MRRVWREESWVMLLGKVARPEHSKERYCRFSRLQKAGRAVTAEPLRCSIVSICRAVSCEMDAGG